MQPNSGNAGFGRKQSQERAKERFRELISNPGLYNAEDLEVPEDGPRLNMTSAGLLLGMELKPVRWIVKDLLPAGLNLLASPPKYGKSWMVLLLCLCVCAGRPFLKLDTVKCSCLYLALEDSYRRLKTRLEKLLPEGQTPEGLYLANESKTLDMGLLEELDYALLTDPDIRLVVVDTLQKVRGDTKEGGYAHDYKELGELKRWADKRDVCVLLVHHLRKVKDESDPFNMISGTNAIMGTADTSLVLTKADRNAETATLSVVGRDVDQTEWALRFQKTTCRWENLGDKNWFEAMQDELEYQESPVVRAIIGNVAHAPGGKWTVTSKELLEAAEREHGGPLPKNPKQIREDVNRFADQLLEIDGIRFTVSKDKNRVATFIFSMDGSDGDLEDNPFEGAPEQLDLNDVS